MIVSLTWGWNIYYCLQAFLLFQFTVAGVVIQMQMATRSVIETDGTVQVCAEIGSTFLRAPIVALSSPTLPGELQTNLTVTLSTSNSDGKAGL